MIACRCVPQSSCCVAITIARRRDIVYLLIELHSMSMRNVTLTKQISTHAGSSVRLPPHQTHIMLHCHLEDEVRSAESQIA